MPSPGSSLAQNPDDLLQPFVGSARVLEQNALESGLVIRIPLVNITPLFEQELHYLGMP